MLCLCLDFVLRLIWWEGRACDSHSDHLTAAPNRFLRTVSCRAFQCFSGSFGDRSAVVPGSLGDCSGSVRRSFGVVLESFRGHSEIVRGSFRGHSGVIRGSIENFSENTNYYMCKL